MLLFSSSISSIEWRLSRRGLRGCVPKRTTTANQGAGAPLAAATAPPSPWAACTPGSARVTSGAAGRTAGRPRRAPGRAAASARACAAPPSGASGAASASTRESCDECLSSRRSSSPTISGPAELARRHLAEGAFSGLVGAVDRGAVARAAVLSRRRRRRRGRAVRHRDLVEVADAQVPRSPVPHRAQEERRLPVAEPQLPERRAPVLRVLLEQRLCRRGRAVPADHRLPRAAVHQPDLDALGVRRPLCQSPEIWST